MTTSIRRFNHDFDAIVTVHGDRTALIPVFDGQSPLTYEQVNGLIGRHLEWFRTLGLQPGDRIGAIVPNSVEMLVLFLSCLRGGYQFAPLACDTSAEEAGKWVTLMQPARIIVGDILPEPVRIGFGTSNAKTVMVTTDGRFAHVPARSGSAQPADGGKLYLFTSGTTGQPKAIVIDGDRLWSAGHAFLKHHGITSDSRLTIWNYLPQSYLGGLFNLCLIPMTVAGAAVVDEAFSGKTFLGFWQTVDRYDITALWLVPTIVRGLIAVGERTGRHQLRSYGTVIKTAFIGTAPIEDATKRRFEDLFGITLLENYALSETTFLTSETPRNISARSEGSVGAPLPYVEFKFRASTDEAEQRYQEVLVKTPFLFDGYFEAGKPTAPSLEDGWFATGDLGYVNAAGQLIVTGRCKDIIKKGGQLVSLREIELVALTHPQVKNAAATACPHPFYGESYRLFVQLATGAAPAAVDDVRKHVFERVAKYKWPEGIEAVDEFPTTGSGKVRKFMLADGGAR